MKDGHRGYTGAVFTGVSRFRSVAELPDLTIGKVVPADPSDLEWDDVARNLEREARPQRRAVAKKWAGSVSGLLAIFGIPGLLKGREDIDALSESARLWTGVLLTIS